MHNGSIRRLTNEQLLVEVKTLAAREREATARLIAGLAEMDARRLYLGQGYSSLFTFCTKALYLSEHAAYGRIQAARTARAFPVVLDLLGDGSITLTTVCLLASLLTSENHRELLANARHLSKREVEHLVASLRPLPPVPSAVRKLPALESARTSSQSSPAAAQSWTARGSSAGETTERPAVDSTPPAAAPPARPAVVGPLASERYKVQFTITRDTHDKFRRVQALLRHSVPDGDPAAVFDRALTLLLEELEKKKLAWTVRPRSAGGPTKARSRHVPAAVRREVWARDGGRCAFVGADGRCAEQGFLEFHHVIPFAAGGPTTTDNLQLRCRAHNAYEAEVCFGRCEPLFAREQRLVYESGAAGLPSGSSTRS